MRALIEWVVAVMAPRISGAVTVGLIFLGVRVVGWLVEAVPRRRRRRS
jgi:hypothetical protein